MKASNMPVFTESPPPCRTAKINDTTAHSPHYREVPTLLRSSINRRDVLFVPCEKDFSEQWDGKVKKVQNANVFIAM